ncbi:hypothetical protein N0V88_002838 [Collariella sp. IMI 366227]|nr:hypothetical protein N0V88_002838 [Collariella sp. IMI 366227]
MTDPSPARTITNRTACLGREYIEYSDGTSQTRKLGRATGQPLADWTIVVKPPAEPEQSSQSTTRQLSVIAENQAEGEPRHWTLFSHIPTRDDGTGPGQVWQVKGDAEFMYFEHVGVVDQMRSDGFSWQQLVCKDLSEEQLKKVDAVCRGEKPPNALRVANKGKNSSFRKLNLISPDSTGQPTGDVGPQRIASINVAAHPPQPLGLNQPLMEYPLIPSASGIAATFPWVPRVGSIRNNLAQRGYQIANSNVPAAPVGDPDVMRNQSAAIAEEESCSLWIVGLAPDLDTHELLAGIRNIGRVYATHINPPAPERGHVLSAAKRLAAELFYTTFAPTGYWTPRNPQLRARVSWNRIRSAETDVGGNRSRVLLVSGPPQVVNEEYLCVYFNTKFEYQLDQVIYCGANASGTRVLLELRFGSFRCQAESARTALMREFKDAGIVCEFELIMRIAKTLLSLALVANAAVASSWFSRAAYNKWHETELERWLSDNDVPYPTPADRKDLEKLVEKNWESNVVEPYRSWDTAKLTSYLKHKGVESKDTAEETRDSLIDRVKSSWYESEDKSQHAWINVKDWILDTWTDSQLKAFCDRHGIPVPQPRKRDTLLQKVRENYETIAQKVGETAAYPGNWLYETWSESDLKEWLDSHGFPAPQPTTRDKLIASVRRNSRLAYLRMQEQAESSRKSAQDAYSALTDKLIDSWGESQLKEFCDKNNINVPQGTKLNQLRALVRKHRAEIMGDTVSGTAASAFGAATSNVGSAAAKATDTASQAAQAAFDKTVNTWTDSRLKGYLDARGVPVPQGSKTEELRALVRKHSHKAATGWTAWTWDDLSLENLRNYLASSGNAAAKKTSEKTGATRDELVDAAQAAYASASSAGGSSYASATSYLARATDAAKATVFDTWSESELKSYLDSYGIPAPQGSTVNELRALARRQHTYFKYGTTTPTETLFAKVKENVLGGWDWVANQLRMGSDAAKKKTDEADRKVHKEL